MVKDFKKVGGERVEVIKHTLNILQECPYVDVHIGTDSQNFKSKTTYVIVIAYKYGTRGVHYIYHKFKVPKIKNKWDRLWKEAELSIEVAQWLREKIKVKIEIDLDYNSDEKYFSNKLIPSITGWANSLGFKTNTKPDNQIATWAADFVCKK